MVKRTLKHGDYWAVAQVHNGNTSVTLVKEPYLCSLFLHLKNKEKPELVSLVPTIRGIQGMACPLPLASQQAAQSPFMASPQKGCRANSCRSPCLDLFSSWLLMSLG